MTEEQLQYVREQLAAGVTPESLRTTLQEAGYGAELVEQLLATAASDNTPTSTAAPAKQLPGYGTFIKETWSVLIQRPDLLLLSIGVFVGLSTVTAYVLSISDDTGIQMLGNTMEVINGLIFLYVLAIILATLLRPDCPTIGSALSWANKNFASIWWLAIVIFLVQFAGYILFIIPGIIISAYIALAYPVRVAEEQRGTAALVRSTALVYNYWWGVMLRMLVYGLTILPLIILSIISTFVLIFLLGFDNPWIDLVTWFIAGIVLVLGAKAVSVLYQYRSAAAPAYIAKEWSGISWTYTIMGWLALPLVALLAVVLMSI